MNTFGAPRRQLRPQRALDLVLAMVGNAGIAGVVDRLSRAGMDDHLTKPTRVDPLVEALSRVSARGQA